MNKPLKKPVLRTDGGGPGRPKVVILGAGPAGLGAALMLAKSGKAEVLVLERETRTGGNAGSFMLDGVWCDFGSHRLHPASSPEVLAMIKDALGDDLLWRPRHGRILLQRRWIHFPLKPADLLARLPKAFSVQLAWDALTKPLRREPPGESTFASILLKGLGPALSRNFYFPYVKKLWALPPEELATTLAHRRVSGSSAGKILAKLFRKAQGPGKTKAGFYYPRQGFGQICDGLKAEAESHGARFELGASVTALEQEGGRLKAVRWTKDGQEHRTETDYAWSTLPITALVRGMEPPAPAKVQAAAKSVRYRGMILIYLVLDQDQFTEYDAHYFPELSVPISRLSEPKNYSAATQPKGATVLCAELPCDPSEPLWALSDDELGAELCGWLGSVGLPVTAKVRKTITRRLGYAYPVYDRGFEQHFGIMDDWASGVEGLLTFGRQGLFAHDNTHHALAMAFGAVDSLQADGRFDAEVWAAHRKVFETHVVED